MLFDHTYRGNSGVSDSARATELSFVPDAGREPTFFTGELRRKLEFREAVSALHDVVVSDLRFRPKDRTAYKEWAAEREAADLAAAVAEREGIAGKIGKLQEELDELRKRRSARWQPFYDARGRYYDFLYKKFRDLWFVLDPVITVHPDEIFFECFSEDESSYGRLGAGYDVFENIGEFACGTTNIDYSAGLYDEFQKIRSYKRTRFEIDPSGFETETDGGAAFREVKIDVPDSWVRGFLQVSSAMSLPAVSFDLHPLDIHNICFILRRRKEKTGPRSMRYILEPGAPVRILFEPWNTELTCARSRYEGEESHEIRVWGRRRLLILERLIAVAQRFTVHLLGTGLPSFYIADLGELNFTLGLSGWTANDWSRAGNFDLLAPRAEVDRETRQKVFEGLRGEWFAEPSALAAQLGLDRSVVLGALAAWTQAGRAVYDLNRGVYRVRELSREPLPLESLRFASEREKEAAGYVLKGDVVIERREQGRDGALELTGTVDERGREHEVRLTIDADERLADAQCECNFFAMNRLTKGPCAHILAVRLRNARGA